MLTSFSRRSTSFSLAHAADRGRGPASTLGSDDRAAESLLELLYAILQRSPLDNHASHAAVPSSHTLAGNIQKRHNYARSYKSSGIFRDFAYPRNINGR